ncbi:hypothetical protein NDN08_000422 [Rhodosorus marinus]|uniref:Dolichyl-phosphate-mannose--protein mannosyltransferase n=1 Tax=Rhodosorus marinus TaxID=101924 RepID=A0AAV8UMW3_9RHOD|nr:hypothetical protein NDN08_000422 [Rhodosorus marinus]
MAKLTGARKRAIKQHQTLQTKSAPDETADEPRVKKPAMIAALTKLLGSVNWIDVTLVVILLVSSFITRFYKIAEPAAVVFDEYHFWDFIAMYWRKTHLFDIHPPLGKLLLLLGGYMGGFQPGDFGADKIGKVYPSTESFVSLRQTSAFFGVFHPALTYLTSRALGCDFVSSFTTGTMVLCETMILIESRFVLVDSQVLFFSQMALLSALYLWKQPPKTTSRWFMVLVTGFFAGCALGIKWTTLATPGIIAIVSFFGLFLPTSRLSIIECVAAAASGLSIYIFADWVHFALSVYSGMGDPFLPPHYQATLIGNKHFDASAKRKPFFPDLFLTKNVQMFRSNKSIKVRHPWESKWYEWILDMRGILYWNNSAGGQERKIYLIGNPAVLLVAASVVVCVMLIVLYNVNRVRLRRKPKEKHPLDQYKIELPFDWLGPAMILLLTYWLNLLPFIFVQRAAFIYHYIPGLYYAILLAGLLMNHLPRVVKTNVGAVIIVGTVFCFYRWSPWVYGLPLTVAGQKSLELFKRWN